MKNYLDSLLLKQTTPLHLYGKIILASFFPLFFFSFQTINTIPSQYTWKIISSCMLFGTLASTFLLIFLQNQRDRLSFLFDSPIKVTPPQKNTPPSSSQNLKKKETSTQDSPNFQNINTSLEKDKNHSSDELENKLHELETCLKSYDKEKDQLLEENSLQKDNLQQLRKEKQTFAERCNKLYEDLEQLQENSEVKHLKQEKQIKEYEYLYQEQQAVIQQKNDQIENLKHQIQNLSYEIKTLIQLSESSSINNQKCDISHPSTEMIENIEENPEIDVLYKNMPSSSNQKVLSPFDASLKLKKSLEIAEKMTGSTYFQQQNSRFKNFSFNSFANDYRRLCDSFRNEDSCVIVLYSPKENKITFTSNLIKKMLGWSADTFSKKFHTLIQEGSSEWKNKIAQLKEEREETLKLVMKNKEGSSITVNCHLEVICQGIFTGHVIGVLF